MFSAPLCDVFLKDILKGECVDVAEPKMFKLIRWPENETVKKAAGTA